MVGEVAHCYDGMGDPERPDPAEIGENYDCHSYQAEVGRGQQAHHNQETGPGDNLARPVGSGRPNDAYRQRLIKPFHGFWKQGLKLLPRAGQCYFKIIQSDTVELLTSQRGVPFAAMHLAPRRSPLQ